ncbi:hypothetical protein [Methylobacterium nonmethylotrophicum]|uniref:Uncharacterized protein n=1 Tax=Methylobacterium nonmethylotrophicum TaxID=1141884 RepID=A0A4Z0NT72_9HYPH|nr:hypothetical protein [Methylobacterium nonmethylotrophicum]TGE00620.1 hypothetical protein EU555_07670 [Methylobacterium nonmethylotrophicum]
MIGRYLGLALAVAGCGPGVAQDLGSAGITMQGNYNTIIYNNGAMNLVPNGAPAEARPVRSGGSLWEHNSSVVSLEAAGNQRRFYYHRPRAGMGEAGARPGSLLFEGIRSGNRYHGTAYIFAGRCGTYPYRVSGTVIQDREVVMRGMAPRIDRSDCQVSGQMSDLLVFRLL